MDCNRSVGKSMATIKVSKWAKLLKIQSESPDLKQINLYLISLKTANR